MSLEEFASKDNTLNPKTSNTVVVQEQETDDKDNYKALQKFDVNAHGHKPTQITSVLDCGMGDNTNSSKIEATSTGITGEEPRSQHTELNDTDSKGNDPHSDKFFSKAVAEHDEQKTCDTGVNIEQVISGSAELSVSSCDESNKNTRRNSQGETSSFCEYKEISSDDEAEDEHEDLTEKAEVESSTSSLSQISPDHHNNPVKDTENHSFDNSEKIGEDEEETNPERPDSLSLPRPLQYLEKKKYIKYHKRGKSDSSYASDVSRSSSTDALIEEASKTPLSSKGTVTKDGDMIAFVAEGLNDLIKLSSPLSQTDSSVSSSLRSPGEKSVSSVSSSTSAWSDVTSSASEWSRDYSRMSRKPEKKATQTQSPSILTASPDDIPPVDPRAVMDLELHAVKVANSVDHMLGTLKNNLSKMSALSYHCLDAHKEAVDTTCDSVDSSIKCMYALMAKCEELSKTMQPVYSLHKQVKEIERLLDLFEGQIAKEDK